MEIKKVHQDKRGLTYSITDEDLQWHELVLFRTNGKNCARGGCIHEHSKEYLTVLEGEIEYFFGEKGEKIILGVGDSFTIEPNTPHYFVNLSETSLVMEWGPPLEEKQSKHERFREIVNAINSQN
jgi:mannose-6-phosphate isomerase-like protein (cupin superfamily)